MRVIFFILSVFLVHHILYADNELFPEIKGWDLKIEKETYTPANLFELIDGAADLYIQYGFQRLYIATYHKNQDMEIRVELYHHNLPENAYGIYTSERMPDYNFIPVGVQGYTGEGILNFLTGEYYVKIMSAGRINAGEGDMKHIAEKIADNLKQNNSWPSEMSFFPEEGKIFMSDGYVAKNFLGYGFLQAAFTAKYTTGGGLTLFIIHGKDKEAEVMLNTYLGMMKEEKVRRQDGIYIVNDFFNGNVYMSLKSDYIAGAFNVRDEKAAITLIKRTTELIGEK